MGIAVIFSFFFLILILKNKNKKENIFSKYLLFIYLISFICNLFFYINPFKNIKQSDVSTWQDTRYIKFVGTIFNVILVPAFFYFTYYGLQTLLNADLSIVRQDTDYVAFKVTFFTPVFTNFATLFFFPLFMYFYSYVNKSLKRQRKYYLISSLSYTALTLCFAGRDGIVYWILNFLVCYLFFKDYIDNKSRRILKRCFIVFAALFGSIFISISFARFIISGYSENLIEPLISYMGQQLGNFSDAFNFRLSKGTLIPGLRYKLFGLEIPDTKYEILSSPYSEEFNVFGYFLKSFIWICGYIGTILLGLLFYIVSKKMKINTNKSIYSFLILLALYQIPLQGVFYYRLGVGGGDLSYLVFVIMCLFMKKLSIQKKIINM